MNPTTEAAHMKYRFPLILLFLCSFHAHAFDNNRQGFCLGIDFGAGLQMNMTQSFVESQTYTGKMRGDFTIPTDFKIGFGKTGKTVFYLSTRNEWKKPGVSVLSVNSILFEVNHFRSQAASSFFICYGAGWAWWLYPLDSYFNEHFAGNGFSCFVGYGYEFDRHFVAKIETFLNSLEHTETLMETKTDFTGTIYSSRPVDYHQWYYVASIRLTIGYLFY
jgi:hypothetical protein